MPVLATIDAELDCGIEEVLHLRDVALVLEMPVLIMTEQRYSNTR
jgi:hypothetical protein